MKKIVCIVCCILLLGACGCQAEQETPVQESTAQRIEREMEEAYREDEKRPEYSSTAGMVELENLYADKWAQIADEYYNTIMEYDRIVQPADHYYSSEDLHRFVSEMKENREQYVQVQCEAYRETLKAVYGPGTIVGPLMARYRRDMQKEWALELVGICETLRIK